MTSNISSKPIQQATKDNSATEQQGTKEKFWYGENRDKLCKFGKVHGENWAELIACSLATSLEIPRAKYIPAEFQVSGRDPIKCVVSQSFINRKGNFSITRGKRSAFSYHILKRGNRLLTNTMAIN